MPDPKHHSNHLPGQDLTFLGDAQYVYHCHHFNLFHDQTVEDALGEEKAFEVRATAAADAARPLLASWIAAEGTETATERLQLASRLFAWMGHGRLELGTDAGGGAALGEHLHYSFAWREKYGEKVRRRRPIDAVAAGFAGAATELAFELEPGSLVGHEASCYACRDAGCRFELSPTTTPGAAPQPGRSAIEKALGATGRGREEDTITRIARGTRDFLLGLEGDHRGLMQGFGLYITRHLTAYYNTTAFDTLHHIEASAPEAVPAVEALFAESAHVCAFFTCGNILLSPEWEALVGPVRGEVEEVMTHCFAIARALGFGHWTLEELLPDERLVMRSSSNYEAPWYLARHGRSEKHRSYFFANAGRAFMELAHGVDWKGQPRFGEDDYQGIFRRGLAWKVEQTACLTRGDAYSEAVVTRA